MVENGEKMITGVISSSSHVILGADRIYSCEIISLIDLPNKWKATDFCMFILIISTLILMIRPTESAYHLYF